MKKVEPKEESAIQKGASTYSNAWKIVNTVPIMMVAIKEILAFLKFFLIISW
jgi:hypothetical protein